MDETLNSSNNGQSKETNICTKKKIKNLVMSGGGIKGIAHIGALCALEDNGYLRDVDTIAGTSIGAFIGILITIGYKPKELYEFVTIFDIAKMGSLKPNHFLNKYGLDDGSKIIMVVKKMFVNKGVPENITFGELYNINKKKIIMTVTCINNKKAYYYSADTFPDMPIIKTLRMSISVPLYFTPIEHEGYMYVDGGCIDNYPIQLFKEELDQTIGIFISDVRDHVEKIINFEDILINTIMSMIEGVSKNSMKGYEKYSIVVSLAKFNLMDLNLTKEKKQELYDAGYNSIINNLDTLCSMPHSKKDSQSSKSTNLEA